jgi:hypothetical protein
MEIEESIRVDNYHKKMKATSLQQKVALSHKYIAIRHELVGCMILGKRHDFK